MGIVNIEGKKITLDDDVIRAGPEAVRQVLSASGFPAAAVAKVVIEQPKTKGGSATVSVTPRSTGKGAPSDLAAFIEALIAAPEYVNPAIALAAESMAAESQGDMELLERAVRTGAVERAIAEGAREGKACAVALGSLGRAIPQTSKTVPVGF
jgi:hypothetical protein